MGELNESQDEQTVLNVSNLSFQVIMDDKIVKSIELGGADTQTIEFMVKSSFATFFAQKREVNESVCSLYCLIFLMERNALNLIMLNYQRTCTGSFPIVIVTVTVVCFFLYNILNGKKCIELHSA